MGKLNLRHDQQRHAKPDLHHDRCQDESAPICACVYGPARDVSPREVPFEVKRKDYIPEGDSRQIDTEPTQEEEAEEKIKDLVVVGAGPHALALILRLLAPEPDFLSEHERHERAEYARRQRPIGQVHKYIDQLAVRSSTVLRAPPNTKMCNKRSNNCKSISTDIVPPPIALARLRQSTMIVDPAGDWLEGWKRNFRALGITQLRSPTNAHADPFDHRAMEIYAKHRDREDELITMPFLSRTNDYRGPYQVPSTSLFEDFHDLLVRSYRVQGMVQKGVVHSITPYKDVSGNALFEVVVKSEEAVTVVKTKRVVCAMGPNFRTGEAFWEASLKKSLRLSLNCKYSSDSILHSHEIVSWLDQRRESNSTSKNALRLLIVGGGITSAQMALLASNRSQWFQSVTMILRSKLLVRQFDIPNKWMGPHRGKNLKEFWAQDPCHRMKTLREARRGGSMPPEIAQALLSSPRLRVKEEVEVHRVEWDNKRQALLVTFDDGSPVQPFDMIWLATGGDNDIDLYPALMSLRQVLPVEVVGGLPVLSSSALSWGSSPYEAAWKQEARNNLYTLGALAGMELGPDALNLIGARHGAVRVAKSIRTSVAEGPSECDP